MRNDAGHVLVGRGLHPDGQAILQEQVERFRFGDDAAAHAHHHFRIRLERAREAATFDPPIARLPIEQKDFRQADSRFALDFAVELHKGNAPVIRECRSKRGLAGTAQSDQGDAFLACRLFVAEFAHQAENDVFEAMLRQPVEEAPDQALLD